MKRGFSLIELMIVIAIISILAMIATPSYKQYIKRAKFSEIITATSIYKTAIALAIQQGIPLKDIKDGSHGIPDKAEPTKYLASLRVKNGVITAKATDEIDNASYILKPSQNGDYWIAAGTCVKYGYCNV